MPHYVFRGWGGNYGGRHFSPRDRGFLPLFMKRLIVLNPAPDRTCLDLICHNDDATVVKTWPEVLDLLEQDYPEEAKVCVIPDGTIQYMKQPGV